MTDLWHPLTIPVSLSACAFDHIVVLVPVLDRMLAGHLKNLNRSNQAMGQRHLYSPAVNRAFEHIHRRAVNQVEWTRSVGQHAENTGRYWFMTLIRQCANEILEHRKAISEDRDDHACLYLRRKAMHRAHRLLAWGKGMLIDPSHAFFYGN